MSAKYIIVNKFGIEIPILFPEAILHAEAVTRISTKLISAGFFEVSDGKVRVSGFSQSLDLESRPEDAAIIERFLK